jgi:hypothetical protein
MVNGCVHQIGFPFCVLGHNITLIGRLIGIEFSLVNMLQGRIVCSLLITKPTSLKAFTLLRERLVLSYTCQIDGMVGLLNAYLCLRGAPMN